MNEDELLEALRRTGLATHVAMSTWADSAQLLSALDAIGRNGANALVKIDGGRDTPHSYTVALSGGRLGDDFFRKDGAELRPLLLEAIGFYLSHADGL